MRSPVRRASTLFLVFAMMLVMAVPGTGVAKPGAAGALGGVVAQGVSAQAWFGSDAYESADDTWTTAPTLPAVSYHTLDSVPGSITYTQDVDWFKVTVDETGTPIYIHGRRLGGVYLDLYLRVFADNGAGKPTTVAVAADDDTDWPWYTDNTTTGVPREYYVAPAPGTYWFRISEIDNDTGNRDIVPAQHEGSCSYELWVSTGGAARVSGADRYATSVEVSHLMWAESDTPYWWVPPAGDGVIIASGTTYADAVAAGALSIDSGLPILLTQPGALPSAVAAEVHRLATATYWEQGDFTVYICGGTGAVSAAVQSALENDPYVYDVDRLAGLTRSGTAASIADQMGGSTSVFLANGWGFADMLSAAPVAGWAGDPILYTATSVVPSETIEWMTDNLVTGVTVCGGTSVVASAALDQIQAQVPGVQTFTRAAGADRYETSFELAALGVDLYGMNGGMPIVASGQDFPDGLSAAQLSYFTGGPVLLTRRDALSPWVQDFYDEYGPFDDAVYVVGGTGAVGAAAYDELNDMWMTP